MADSEALEELKRDLGAADVSREEAVTGQYQRPDGPLPAESLAV